MFSRAARPCVRAATIRLVPSRAIASHKMQDKGGNLKQKPEDTIFAKIVAGQIPSKKVWEDDKALAFHDISPQAPIHVLIIPKQPIGGIGDADESHAALLGHLLVSANKVAKVLNMDEGYRLVVNEGKHGQQSVRWLHIHLLGGRQLTWPPG